MRFGVVLIPTDPWPTAVAQARRLDELGYDHLWVYDHLSWRRFRDEPWHATYPWLSGLAMATERIRLGTLVSNLNIRHPLTLAKDAMTIDHLSDGRFILGLGAAGIGYDATALGQEPLTPGQRIARLAEATELLDGLLTGTIEDHHGDFYEVNGGRTLPGSVQQPRLPFAIAAGGPKGIRVAARHADAWITYGDTSGAELDPVATERIVAEQTERLEASCAEIGRDPAEIERIYVVGLAAEKPLHSIEQFTDFVGRYEALGFTDIVFHHPRPGDPIWDDPVEIVDEIAERFLSPRR